MGMGDFLSFVSTGITQEDDELKKANAAKELAALLASKEANTKAQTLENTSAQQRLDDEAAARAILAKLPELMANKQSAEKLGQIDLNDHAGDSDPNIQPAAPGLSAYQQQTVADQADAKYPSLGGMAGQNVLGNQGLTADTAKAGGYDVPQQAPVDPNAPQTNLITGQTSGTRYAGVDGTPHPFSDAQSTDQADAEAAMARKAGAGIAQGQAQLDQGTRELGKTRTQVLGDMGGLQYAGNSPTMQTAYSMAGTQDQRDAFTGRKMAAMAQENDPLVRQRIALAADDKALGDVYNDKYTQTTTTQRMKELEQDRQTQENLRHQETLDAMGNRQDKGIAAKGTTSHDKDWVDIQKAAMLSGRGVNKTVVQAQQTLVNSNRALQLLSNPSQTTQDQQIIAGDLNQIFTGRGATEMGMKEQTYNTAKSKIADMMQYWSGHPQSALPADIKAHLVGILSDLKVQNVGIMKDYLDELETGRSTVIGAGAPHETDWQTLRAKMLNGGFMANSQAAGSPAPAQQNDAITKLQAAAKSGNAKAQGYLKGKGISW